MSEVQWFYEDGGARKGPVSEDAIKGMILENRIRYGTAVWRTGMSEWVVCERSDLAQHLSAVPPPLHRSAVLDFWLWALAVSPVIWFFIDTTEMNGWMVAGWILNITLCALDIQQLKKAGYPKPSVWWSLFVPGYLFMRSRKVKGNQAPLIVWLALFLAPLFIIL